MGKPDARLSSVPLPGGAGRAGSWPSQARPACRNPQEFLKRAQISQVGSRVTISSSPASR